MSSTSSAEQLREEQGIRIATAPNQPVWLDHAQRFRLLQRLALRFVGPVGDLGCWGFRGAHSRGARREVAYPNLRLGPKTLGPIRVNRLVLVLGEVPTRVFTLGTEADLLLWVLRLNQAHRDHDAAHQCDARGLGAGCVHQDHLRWESHLCNVRHGLARKAQRDATARMVEYTSGIRLGGGPGTQRGVRL